MGDMLSENIDIKEDVPSAAENDSFGIYVYIYACISLHLLHDL